MSIELLLTTFEDPPLSRQSAAALADLADSLRSTVKKLGGSDEDVEPAAEEVLVHLPGGTAVIHADHAIFPITGLDPLTLGVVYDVARSADMVIVPDGAECSAIVVSAAQRTRLPEEDRTPAASPVCRGRKQLGALLENWFRVNAEYREQAVESFLAENTAKQVSVKPAAADLNADWAAEHPANPVKMSDYSGPGPASFRYDPWVGDHVVDGPESVSVTLHRFDPGANGTPRRAEILRKLHEVCERHRNANPHDCRKLIADDREWPPLELRMRFYTAHLWPDDVEFTLYELNDSIAEFMLEIARTGDMSFVPPGGVLLTEPRQADRLPQNWKQTMRIVACPSARDLKYWLRCLAIDWSPGVDDGFRHLFDDGEIATGTYPTPRRRHVYLEARPKETAAKQQNRFFRHQSPVRPESGMMMGGFWRLETPAGRRFHAYNYSGDWLPHIRDFAAAEQCALGCIVNFETFVQDDGERFPLGECAVRKVDPHEK